mgnify:CR=1 FL=1
MSKTFTATNPATGQPVGQPINENTFEEVSAAIAAAEKVKKVFAETTPTQRAALLHAIADSIESEKEKLAEISHLETGLPLPRVTGEVMRTVIQIRAFADLVKTGGHLLPIIDLADANFQPVARPDLRKSQQSLGVVSIFAASNFPLAFSVAGGDTASALAAGCPVVVKAHPSHPNTCQLVYQAIVKAIQSQGLPKEIFALVQGVNPEITHWLAKDPKITAIGFTGSGLVGKLLIKLAQEREIPIPVFAEMGSLNPVFFTPGALAEKAEELAKAAMDSALLGSGQFCTKPGIMIVPKDAAGDKFIAQVQSHVAEQKVGPLLNKGIATRFTEAISSISKAKGVKVLTGVTNPDGYVLVSYLQAYGDTVVNLLMSQSVTVDGSGTSYYGSPSVTVAGSWYPLTQNGSASTITRLSNGNYLLTATIYIDSTVDSALFVATTGGLDVDAIPNEVTTRIILNSSKSSILAQAINIGAKGVK